VDPLVAARLLAAPDDARLRPEAAERAEDLRAVLRRAAPFLAAAERLVPVGLRRGWDLGCGMASPPVGLRARLPHARFPLANVGVHP